MTLETTFAVGFVLAANKARWIHFSMTGMEEPRFKTYLEGVKNTLRELGEKLTAENVVKLGDPPLRQYTNFELLVTMTVPEYLKKATFYNDTDIERGAPIDWLT